MNEHDRKLANRAANLADEAANLLSSAGLENLSDIAAELSGRIDAVLSGDPTLPGDTE